MKHNDYKKEIELIEKSKLISFIRKNIIYIIMGILLIISIFYKVDFKETMQYLLSIPLWFVLLLLIINFLVYSLWIFRWKIIIEKVSKINYFVLYPIFFAGGLINQLTPGSKSGGQPLRAYYLSKINKKDFADNLSTTLFSFLSGSYVSLIFLIASIIYLSTIFPFSVYFSVIVGLTLTISLVLFLIYLVYKVETKSKSAKKILSIIYRIKFIKKKYKTFNQFEQDIFKEARETFRETKIFLKDKTLVLKQMAIEFLAYLLQFLKIYLLFQLLGVQVPFTIIALTTVISQMLGFIMFSPGGLGIVEGSNVGLYFLFGINPEIAAAVTIVNRALIYVYEFVIGYISLLYLRKKN